MIAKAPGQSEGATAMIDDWFSAIELPLTWQQFWQLPQNPAYKYEYFDGHAWLSPRPKSYHAVLDLQTFARPIDMVTDDKVTVRSNVEHKVVHRAASKTTLLPPSGPLAHDRSSSRVCPFVGRWNWLEGSRCEGPIMMHHSPPSGHRARVARAAASTRQPRRSCCSCGTRQPGPGAQRTSRRSHNSRCTLFAVWPSPTGDEVGAPIKVISELDGWPACAPVNASPAMLPPPA